MISFYWLIDILILYLVLIILNNLLFVFMIPILFDLLLIVSFLFSNLFTFFIIFLDLIRWDINFWFMKIKFWIARSQCRRDVEIEFIVICLYFLFWLFSDRLINFNKIFIFVLFLNRESLYFIIFFFWLRLSNLLTVWFKSIWSDNLIFFLIIKIIGIIRLNWSIWYSRFT